MADKEQILNKAGLQLYDSLIKQYTDQLILTHISNLIDSAPENRNTLLELSNAINENSDVLEVLNSSITSKANKTDLTTHTSNSSIHTSVKASSVNGNIIINGVETAVYTHPSGTNPHGTTAADVGLGKVNNTADADKRVLYATSAGTSTSATKATQDSAGQQINTTYIKGLSVNGKVITYTKGDGSTGTITTQDTDTTYSAAGSTLGLVKSGGDVTISSGVITIIDDSHNHSASNITSGTLGAARGGTGATSFTSGEALIGNGTDAITTRSITNMTAKSYITYNTNLMTTNTLAYWNGAYASNGASNLSYCNYGAFGTAATYSATSSITSGGYGLITSGAVYTALSGKASGYTFSGTTPATAGWYRIATTSSNIGNCTGLFRVVAGCSGYHTVITFIPSTSFGISGSSNITILSCGHYGNAALTKVRIVYHTSYEGNFAYVEVYSPNAKALGIDVQMIGQTGWSSVTPSTAGSIPSGYSNKEYTLTNETMVSKYFQGTASNAAFATSAQTISASTGNTLGMTAPPGTGKIMFHYNVNAGQAGMFPSSNNANMMITINKHDGNYDSQLAFSNNGNIYYRNFDAEALNTTKAWRVLAFTDSTVANATNADKLDGYHGSTSNTANTYVLRDSNNYIYTYYINSNTSNNENPSISQIIVTNGNDNYYRKASLAHLKDYLSAGILTVGTYTNTSTAVTGGIKVHDLRDITPVPGMFGGNVVNYYFDTTSVDSGNWKAIMSITGWSATSYATHELAFNATNAVTYQSLYHRTGMNGTFEGWRCILDSGNYTSYTVTKTGSGASGSWGISVTGSSASCTGNSATSTVAAKLGRGGNTALPMVFNWSGQSGTPTWVWGGSDGTNMYVYSPASFSVNYATSAGSATCSNTVLGSYTSNGGQQNPNYFGKNRVGFLMMNTAVNGNTYYKDWMIMDCYSGNDVGGAVAIGVNRQTLGAYIMRSAAERTSWAESAELLHSSNYTSFNSYGTLYTSNWFRSTGATGWYSETYGGGWYMTDTTWIRSYGSKSIYQNSGILRTDGTLQVGANGTYLNASSSGVSIGTNLTVTGTLILSNTTSAAQTSDTACALKIGNTAGTHMVLDGNSVMTKASATTTAPLHINASGGNVTLGNVCNGRLVYSNANSVCEIKSNSNIVLQSAYVSSSYPGAITLRSAGYWTSASDYNNGTIQLQDKNSNTWIHLAFDATSSYFASKAIYNRTTSGGTAVRIDASGLLLRYSSASKYKLDIETISDETYAYNILKLNPKSWYDKSEVESYSRGLEAELNGEDPSTTYASYDNVSIERINGLVAEDVEKAGLDKYCTYEVNTKEDTKELEGINYEKLTTLLIPVVRDLVLYTQKTAKYIHVDEINESDRDAIATLLTRINSFKESEVIT